MDSYESLQYIGAYQLVTALPIPRTPPARTPPPLHKHTEAHGITYRQPQQMELTDSADCHGKLQGHTREDRVSQRWLEK